LKEIVLEIQKALLNFFRYNFAKNWSNIGQTLVKHWSNIDNKNGPKIAQKVVKTLSKFCSKFKTSGEDDDDEEEDWWLLDQVATSSHLVKI
jgi:hypothetical protein